MLIMAYAVLQVRYCSMLDATSVDVNNEDQMAVFIMKEVSRAAI